MIRTSFLLPLFQTVVRDRFIYFTTFAIFSISVAILYQYDLTDNIVISHYLAFFFSAIKYSIAVYLVCYYFYLITKREPRPTRAYLHAIKRVFVKWYEIVNLLFIIIAISFCFSSFTAIKQSIPYIVPFYLDDLLIKLDYLMHFNSHPWELTHYLFSGQVWSMVINFLYNVWFLILWFFLVTILISVSKPQRPTIIISFLLCWFINGNILAILLSSVGPVFYGNLVDGSTPYSELMTMLYQQHELLIESDAYITLWALTTQEALWATHLAAENNIGAGISAMPSMHVSIAVMMALACSSLNKKLGVVMWLFAGMIMIGSVHLAWHYALDGYVSFITTTLIWKTVGYFCRKPSLQQDRRFIPVSQ